MGFSDLIKNELLYKLSGFSAAKITPIESNSKQITKFFKKNRKPIVTILFQLRSIIVSFIHYKSPQNNVCKHLNIFVIDFLETLFYHYDVWRKGEYIR